MAVERKPAKIDRQKRLTRGNSHYEFLSSGFQLKESTGSKQNHIQSPVPVRSFIVPENICHKVKFKNIETPVIHSLKMSVEESLQYLDDTLAELDKVSPNNHLYESESDMLSEFGYASGYTELSVTTDSEHHLKPSGVSSRRRKSRQNRNQRYQSDPILGDLESDSTNDGCLFGNGITVKTKTKTNSGQRRQRERRRQRRQNANRNSWTDSGLSLLKTDSQRSSHSENSPLKRGRSKTSPADLDLDAKEVENEIKHDYRKDLNDKASSPIQMDCGIHSPNIDSKCPNMDSMSLSNLTLKYDESDNNNNNNNTNNLDISNDNVFIESDKENRRETGCTLSPSKTQDIECEVQSLKSLDTDSNCLDHSFINIKPTNANGVINGTYSPKEKEILQQVFQNARNSCSSVKLNEHPSFKREAMKSPASRFPLPPHLDYPLCMYRDDAKPKKNKKSGGIMRGFKRLKEGLSSKRRSFISGDEAKLTNAREFHNQTHLGGNIHRQPAALPPSKSVEKKKGLLKRIFKSQESRVRSKPQNPAKKTQFFSRDRFGSSRSFSESIGQLWSRGNRARTQSMENLKNMFRRQEKGAQFMKRSSSSTSLAAKLPRSLSLTSLIGRRGKQFTRHGSVASVAASCSRQQNNYSGFRRTDSVRSLQGGYGIATRLLQSQNSYRQSQNDGQCYEDSNENYMSPYGVEMNVPFRAGWRPSSRISRRDPYYTEENYYYDEDFEQYDNFYEDEGPCTCGCDDQYTENGYCYEDHEHFIGHSTRKQDCYGSRNTINQQYFESGDQRMLPSRQSFSRQSSQPMNMSSYAPSPCLSSSYNSPRSYRAENRKVVAPLNVQVTQERRAERRQLSRASQVFDTMV